MKEDNCKGIFGMWFGHKFESMIVESIPYKMIPDIKGTSYGIKIINESLSNKKYKIVCKRCGEVQK